MRIVIDYRPALKARTGVGEYIHQTIKALGRGGSEDRITLFSSSWKDRPSAETMSELPRARVVDRRIPVRFLNLAWHRLGWPSIETLTADRYDVAHSPHPLLLPSRSAAQLVTIHDLHFIAHPERTSHEMRRDYPALARRHAHRADRIIVSSRFAAGEVRNVFDIPHEKIAVCPAGVPEWAGAVHGGDADGYLLFLGTLDARKNIGGLLDGYARLLSSRPHVPRLILAGRPTTDSAKWLEAIARPPLAGHVEHAGYVEIDRRAALFRGAKLFVLPSFEEGFGLPALEAMAAGVPVVAANTGSLPEVIGDAGLLINPDDPESLAAAIARILDESELWQALRGKGFDRAREFSWDRTARDLRRAYEDAVTAHAHRH